MEIAYYITSVLLIVITILPFISDQHWIFRSFDFVRIQLLVFQLIVLAIGFIVIDSKGTVFWIIQGLFMLFILYSAYVLLPFTPIYRARLAAGVSRSSELISILSVNVYQFNKEYHQLVSLIREKKPDIFLTMESNRDWEEALSELDAEYKHHRKIALENTYGMHFYSNVKVNNIQTHYFVADDVPSIEVDLETESKIKFTMFGIHPPPPSPTEEENSKERDGELLSVAKKVRKLKRPVIVLGDFNNVAWAKSSILFRKTSELIDPRIGRGFVSTFHARSRLFRFPLDLFFHSPEIYIEDFKTLNKIGSDHLPLFCQFFISLSEDVDDDGHTEELDEEEEDEVEEMIEEGKEEESDRPAVATD